MIFTGINIFLLCLVSIFIGTSVVVFKVSPKTLFYNRKALHISVLSSLALSINYLTKDIFFEFALFLIVCEFILVYFVLKGFFETETRKSWGIIYFLPPIIFFLLVFPQCKFEISVSVWILAFSDGFSAVLGRLLDFDKWKYLNEIKWGSDRKTLIGSMVFFISSLCIFQYFGVFNSNLKAVFASLVLTTVELICGKGSDNLFIPVISFFIMLFLKNLTEDITVVLQSSLWILLVIIPLLFIVLKFKWLSNSGLFFAVYLAFFSILTHTSLWPLIVFFILGTLTGKLNKNENSDVKHSQPRDVFQVLANGGVIFMILIYHGINQEFAHYYVFVLISIAVACADTLSSEIGMKFGKQTYHVITLQPIERGVSGGVSLAGLLGAIFGSLTIALFDLNHFAVVFFWGIIGSVVDSLFGVLFQAKYLNQGVLTDRKTNELVGGFQFVNNDLVNFVSNLIVVLLAYFTF